MSLSDVSVCLSVTRLVMGPYRPWGVSSCTPNITRLIQREHPKIWLELGGGYGKSDFQRTTVIVLVLHFNLYIMLVYKTVWGSAVSQCSGVSHV